MLTKDKVQSIHADITAAGVCMNNAMHTVSGPLMLQTIRQTEGVTGASRLGRRIAVSVTSESRAIGLAETLRETGFPVVVSGRLVVFG